jgi:hypothetical protein
MVSLQLPTEEDHEDPTQAHSLTRELMEGSSEVDPPSWTLGQVRESAVQCKIKSDNPQASFRGLQSSEDQNMRAVPPKILKITNLGVSLTFIFGNRFPHVLLRQFNCDSSQREQILPTVLVLQPYRTVSEPTIPPSRRQDGNPTIRARQ